MNVKTILLFLFFLSSLQSFGQSMNVILVANTKSTNPEFAEICKIDSSNMRETFEDIAKTMNMKLKMHWIIGDQFNSKDLKKLISSLQFDKDDICFFYFSGAGFCEEGGIDMDCNRVLRMGKDGKDLLPTTQIFPVLEEKGARLNIEMVDACARIRNFPKKGGAQSDNKHSVYQTLFSATGTIRLFSSKCTQYSYGFTEKGSVFTNCFIEVLDFFIHHPHPNFSWDVFFSRIHDTAYQKVKKAINRPQNPTMCRNPKS